MPHVSIIMATYNAEKTLKARVDSILEQTFKDWEFIICDDCSQDNSYNILLDYKKMHPNRFVILRNEVNSKLSFSLNKCLEVAQGEYVARMDADDTSLPTRLEKQVDFLDAHPEFDVVGTAMLPFNEDGDFPPRYAKPCPEPSDMLNRSPFYHATIMMRKSAYDKVNGYTVSKRTERAQDYDMWFRFFSLGLKGYNLQLPLYHVREDSEAMKRRTFKSRCYEVITKLKGYKLLHFPVYLYVFAFKPIFAALTPNTFIELYHKRFDSALLIQK